MGNMDMGKSMDMDMDMERIIKKYLTSLKSYIRASQFRRNGLSKIIRYLNNVQLRAKSNMCNHIVFKL